MLTQKLYYTIAGSLLSLINIYLINTRFNIVGLGFGLIAVVFFIKALSIRKNEND